MFGERNVNLQMTSRTRAFVERFAAQLRLDDPLLTISSSRVHRESIERWVLSMCERRDVREAWIGHAPDFDFAVVQQWALDALDNQLLDFDDRTGVVTLSSIR